jgi:hypothetical protein
LGNDDCAAVSRQAIRMYNMGQVHDEIVDLSPQSKSRESKRYAYA